MKLDDPVVKIPSVGQVVKKRLEKLGIKTTEDLVNHFPSRYLDYSLVSSISAVQLGETVTVRGTVIEIKNQYTRGGKKIQKAKIADKTGQIGIIWFNQPYLTRTILVNSIVSLSGKIDFFGKERVLVSPEHEIIQEEKSETIHTGRLVPIYAETRGLSSKWLRGKISKILPQVTPQIAEFLPKEVLDKENLIDRKSAYNKIHFPNTLFDAEIAKQRLSFDELFLLHTTVLERKRKWDKKKARKPFLVDKLKIAEFVFKLPFALTSAQKRVVGEILSDLSRPTPMNRLLEGDVGSGKTVIAAVAAFAAHLNLAQTAIMAPTQILAEQHHKTLKTLLSPYGIKIGLVTAAKKKASGRPGIVIGTHALIHKTVDFENLGLVVIDEQHRFGVEQRAHLAQKGIAPHILTMTATPIPRTIALTLWGDLDLSILDEMPPGRIPVKCWLVPEVKRLAGYKWVKNQIRDSAQVFIVFPFIEESQVETLKSVKAATAEFEKLSKTTFKELALGLLHGRIKPKEKDEILTKFREGKLDILVATPVVEVGIDIPGATIMIVEGSERFGLAQLHQLRGRVGRSDKQSYCLLFSSTNSPKALTRLKYLEKSKTGLELAELDLKLRGPGEMFGTAQHGFPELKIASFYDSSLIAKTRKVAQGLFPQILKNPTVKKHLSKQSLVAPN